VPFLGLNLLQLWDRVSPFDVGSVKRRLDSAMKREESAEKRRGFYETALLLVT
jgi:hypothetical protein